MSVAGVGALHTAAASASGPTAQAAGWLTRNSVGSVGGWSTTGIKPVLADLGNGKWKAIFPNITGAFGVPAVTPGNQYPGAMCAINTYAVFQNDLGIVFHCTDRNGVGVKGNFTVTYTSIAGASEGWVRADQPSFNGIYKATAQYNATGVDVTIAHAANSGQYTVTFPGLILASTFGSVTVTPVMLGIGHCVTSDVVWGSHTDAKVTCFTIGGQAADMAFVAHLVGKRPVLAAAGTKTGWAMDVDLGLFGAHSPSALMRYTANGQTPSVNHSAVGTYVFTFKNLTSIQIGAQAYGYTDAFTDVRCGAVAVRVVPDMVVNVKCVDAAGKPVNTFVQANVFGV